MESTGTGIGIDWLTGCPTLFNMECNCLLTVGFTHPFINSFKKNALIPWSWLVHIGSLWAGRCDVSFVGCALAHPPADSLGHPMTSHDKWLASPSSCLGTASFPIEHAQFCGGLFLCDTWPILNQDIFSRLKPHIHCLTKHGLELWDFKEGDIHLEVPTPQTLTLRRGRFQSKRACQSKRFRYLLKICDWWFILSLGVPICFWVEWPMAHDKHVTNQDSLQAHLCIRNIPKATSKKGSTNNTCAWSFWDT